MNAPTETPSPAGSAPSSELVATPVPHTDEELAIGLAFGVAVTQLDCVAPVYGAERLRAYFSAEAANL